MEGWGGRHGGSHWERRRGRDRGVLGPARSLLQGGRWVLTAGGGTQQVGVQERWLAAESGCNQGDVGPGRGTGPRCLQQAPGQATRQRENGQMASNNSAGWKRGGEVGARPRRAAGAGGGGGGSRQPTCVHARTAAGGCNHHARPSARQAGIGSRKKQHGGERRSARLRLLHPVPAGILQWRRRGRDRRVHGVRLRGQLPGRLHLAFGLRLPAGLHPGGRRLRRRVQPRLRHARRRRVVQRVPRRHVQRRRGRRRLPAVRALRRGSPAIADLHLRLWLQPMGPWHRLHG
jgi:hypothetical protein